MKSELKRGMVMIKTMTLDEAITHFEQKAHGRTACGDEHRQLDAWLLDLKKFMEKKSEADKVIAELKALEDVLVTDNRNLLDKVKKLENQLRETAEHFQRNEAQILENAEKEIRHHKYKRCLAMAMWCRTSARCDEKLGAFKYRDWYWKWFKRWLTLADKYKEGNV